MDLRQHAPCSAATGLAAGCRRRFHRSDRRACFQDGFEFDAAAGIWITSLVRPGRSTGLGMGFASSIARAIESATAAGADAIHTVTCSESSGRSGTAAGSTASTAPGRHPRHVWAGWTASGGHRSRRHAGLTIAPGPNRKSFCAFRKKIFSWSSPDRPAAVTQSMMTLGSTQG